MRLQTIFFLYRSHLFDYLNIKKYSVFFALLLAIVGWYVNSTKDTFRTIFEITQTDKIIEDFYIFFVLSGLAIVLIVYIIGTLIFSSINSAVILYKYIGFEKNKNEKLLLDKINEFYIGKQYTIMDFKDSDKLLLLYLYDLRIIT